MGLVDLQVHARDGCGLRGLGACLLLFCAGVAPRIACVIGADQRLKVAFHDDGILTVGIVARALADGVHPQRFVERLRTGVACTHFQRNARGSQVAGVGGNAADQLAGDTAAAPGGVGADLEDLHLAVDDHAAGIADQALDRLVGGGSGFGGVRIGRSGCGSFAVRGAGFALALGRRCCGVCGPPGPVGARQFVGNLIRIPGVRAHDLGFHRCDISCMRGIERLVRDAMRVGSRV